jgi:hypothetical protein
MSETNIENQLRIANTELNTRIASLKEKSLGQERTEATLQASEKRYRRLFESAKDGIYPPDRHRNHICKNIRKKGGLRG